MHTRGDSGFPGNALIPFVSSLSYTILVIYYCWIICWNFASRPLAQSPTKILKFSWPIHAHMWVEWVRLKFSPTPEVERELHLFIRWALLPLVWAWEEETYTRAPPPRSPCHATPHLVTTRSGLRDWAEPRTELGTLSIFLLLRKINESLINN